MKQSSRVFAWFTLLLALLLLNFYGQYLANRASFFIYDLYAGWQPFLTYMGERLSHGELPLWNPYVLSGISQIDIVAPTIFYPLNTLFAVLPFNPAYATMMVLQQMIAGIGMFLLVRSFSWGSWAAALAGATLALCGTMFSLQPTPTMMGTIAWFTIAWWGQRLIDAPAPDRKLLHTAADILFVYFMITAGVAEAFAPALIFLGVAAIAEYLSAAKHARRRAQWVLLLRLLALFIGTLMSACAVLPAAEWSRLSPRAHGLSLFEVFAWSCNWYDWLCTIVIQPLGDMYVPTNGYRALVATSNNQTPYLANSFIGPIVTTLALWGACDRRFKFRWLAIAVLVGASALSLGSHLPGLVAVVKALNLRVFRYPVKAMVFVSLSAALLAARGMHVFVKGRPSAGNAIAWVLWIASALGGMGLQLVGSHPSGLAQLHITGLWPAALVKSGTALLGAASVGLLCAWLWRLRQQEQVPSQAAAAIMLLGTVALFMTDAWLFNQHKGPADFYEEPSLVAGLLRHKFPAQGNLLRCAVNYENPHPPAALIDKSAPTVSVYGYSRSMMAPSTSISMKIDNVVDYVVGQTADNKTLWRSARDLYFDHENSGPLGVLCQMTGARAICNELGYIQNGVVGKRLPKFDDRYFRRIIESERLNLGLYGVHDPLPRTYFAPTTKWGKPHDAVIHYVGRPDESGFDPHRQVVLEHLRSNEVGPAVQANEAAVRASKAVIKTDRPEYLRIEASTPVDNFLIVADQFYPGWHAKVDGQRAPIYPANVILRAVFVPSGHHIVEFTYAPASLHWGLLLHALGWLVIIKLLVLAWLTGRSQHSSIS